MAENKFRSIGGVVTSLQLLVLAKNAIEQLLGLEPGQLATVVERAGDRFALSTWRSASVWDIMNVQKTFVKKPHLQQTVNSHAIEYGFTDMAGWSAENTVLKVIEKLGAPQYLAGRATNVALTHPQPRFGNGEEKSLACNGLLTSSQLLKYICKVRFRSHSQWLAARIAVQWLMCDNPAPSVSMRIPTLRIALALPTCPRMQSTKSSGRRRIRRP